MKNKVLIPLIVISLLYTGCSSNVTTKDSNENTVDKSDDATSENNKSLTVGETAEYSDVQITMLDYDETIGVDEWSQPMDGNVFVHVHFQIVNNTREELEVSSMLSFDSYCDDDKLEYSTNANFIDYSRQTMDGSVMPGKMLDGYMGYEVPAGWQKLDIFYMNNLWNNYKIHFVISK